MPGFSIATAHTSPSVHSRLIYITRGQDILQCRDRSCPIAWFIYVCAPWVAGSKLRDIIGPCQDAGTRCRILMTTLLLALQQEQTCIVEVFWCSLYGNNRILRQDASEAHSKNEMTVMTIRYCYFSCMHSLVVVDSSAKLLSYASTFILTLLYKCTIQLSVIVDSVLHTYLVLIYSREKTYCRRW